MKDLSWKRKRETAIHYLTMLLDATPIEGRMKERKKMKEFLDYLDKLI